MARAQFDEEDLLGVELAQQGSPNPFPRAIFQPFVQAPPAGRIRPILMRQVFPSTASFQHIQNAVQRLAVISPFAPRPRFLFRDERFNDRPLLVV